MNIYEELGLRTVINASGTLTRLGGSRMAPETLAAMAEAAAAFVAMDDLQARAGEVIAELKTLGRERYVSSYFLAIIYLGLGKTAEALDALEQAYEERSGFLPFIGVEPMLDPLRGEARFRELMDRVGIMT